MPSSLSAQKRVRQNLKRRGLNRWRKTTLKDVRKEFDEAILHGTTEQAGKKLRELAKAVDKVAAKGTIHKKTASRRKSRAALQLNKKAARTSG